jgi:hypothetical protein
MRFECSGCKKSFSGAGLTVNLTGNEQMYCADCYWKLQKEYGKKKSCENCGYFEAENCEKNGKKMKPAKVGFNEYFVEAETCRNYTAEKKTGSDKKKNKELTEEQKEAQALAKNLADKKETLTYFCPHCGAPLKIGAKAPEIQKTCPKCNGDLEIVNLARFIKQHQS